jgi:uncharacterized Zn-binding protein involved in type VI secretion
MSFALAARKDDIIKHSSKLLGFFAGAVAAVAIGLLVVGTGGLGLAAIAGLAAVGGAVGLGAGALYDALAPSPGVETGVVGPGSSNILINNRDAAAVTDLSVCYFPVVYNHGPKAIVEGSGTVFYACRPAARKGDALLCDATIATGSENVLIGGPAVRIKGTRRTFLDTILDYGSMYLTVVFAGGTLLGFAVTGAVIGISDAWQRSMHTSPGPVSGTTVNRGAIVLGGGAAFLADGRSISYFNAQETARTVAANEASRRAAQNAMYADYVARKTAQGQVPWSRARYLNNNLVNQAVTRRAPPVRPKLQSPPSWRAAAGGIAAQLGVDIVRVWREAEREAAIPENPSCDDTSWLEPA